MGREQKELIIIQRQAMQNMEEQGEVLLMEVLELHGLGAVQFMEQEQEVVGVLHMETPFQIEEVLGVHMPLAGEEH